MLPYESIVYASRVLDSKAFPHEFSRIEVAGVRFTGEMDGVRQVMQVDNGSPDLFTTYARRKDGPALAIADFCDHGRCVEYAKDLAERYKLEFHDAVTAA